MLFLKNQNHRILKS